VQIRLILGDQDPPLDEVVAIGGAVPRLLLLLEHPDEETRRSAAMCVTYLACGGHAVISADAAQAIIGMGVLQLMAPLMQPQVEPLIRKECCWTLGNEAAGTHAQVQAVLDSGLMPFVIRCMSDPEFEVKEEAVWVVANIGAAGAPDQLRAAVKDFPCIRGLSTALRTGDVTVILTALEACKAVLALGDSLRSADTTGTRGVNPYVLQGARYCRHPAQLAEQHVAVPRVILDVSLLSRRRGRRLGRGRRRQRC
jgi:hypothetical protein